MHENLFKTYLGISLYTSVIIAALLLLERLFSRKHTARWKYILWIVTSLKKRGVFAFCVAAVISFLAAGGLTGCVDSISARANKDISSITLAFKEDPVEDYSFVITQKENIEEAMRIYQKLKRYKSPAIDTWFMDVAYNIQYADGKSVGKTFKKIRPAEDIFEKILDSVEVRQQREPVLRASVSDITKLDIYSPITGEKLIYDNIHDIEHIMLSLKEFYKTDEVLSDTAYVLAEVEFFGKDANNSSGCMLLRDDKATQRIIGQQGHLDALVVNPDDVKDMKLTDDKTGKTVEITDAHIMQIVLDNYQNGWASQQSIITVSFNLKSTKGKRLDWHGSFFKGMVPEEIQQLFK